MNAPSPNPIPSPLVPQGSIPPKTTSRSGRVFWIALMVFGLHLGGLSLVLLQGCQKDAKTAGTSDTNTTTLSYAPIETNPPASQYYTSATNLPAPVTYTPTNVGAPTTLGMTPPANVGAPIPQPPGGVIEPPTSLTPTPAVDTTLHDYKVASRDTLDSIARKHHITLKALKEANPNVDPVKLKVGQNLKIPAIPLPTLGATATARTTPAASPAGAVATGSYKVKSGDTLTRIAKANGVTIAQLRAANNMKTTRIQVGQTLKIPARSTAAAPTETTPQ